MFLLKSWYFVFVVILHCGKCVAANFSNLERFKIKRPPKWWMSQYVYNKHNTTWKVLCTVCTHSLFLYQKSYSFTANHSFDFWSVNNSCVSTVRQHFPSSILYILFILLIGYYYPQRFVIFTCRYFKLSWNTPALSQSNCRNLSCRSITSGILLRQSQHSGAKPETL